MIKYQVEEKLEAERAQSQERLKNLEEENIEMKAKNTEIEVKLKSVQQQNQDLLKDIGILSIQLRSEKQVYLSIISI